MRAVQEGRGFSDGSVQVVRDRKLPQRDDEMRSIYTVVKRSKTQARQGAVSTLQGAYIDVRYRKGTERQHSIAPRILRFLA